MGVVPPVERLQPSPATKSFFLTGRATNTSSNSSSETNQESKRFTVPCCWSAATTTFLFTDTASRKIFQRLCNAGARVQRNVYPGLGHDPVVYGSLRDQLDWIAARFAGEPAPSNCPVS